MSPDVRSIILVGDIEFDKKRGRLKFTASSGAGSVGPQGPQGEPGAAGPQGPKGDTGDAGAAGAQGPKGDKGDPGDTGPQGPAGNDGAAGAAGQNGAQGPQGEQGPAGPAGADGDDGEDGAPGQQGIQGQQGVKGDKGDAGQQGIQGVPGPNLTTSAFGYTAGAGGVVTQATSKSTGVTINKLSGQITTHNAALSAAAEVSFTVTNNQVSAVDVPCVAWASGGAQAGAYAVDVTAVANGSFRITISNLHTASLSEALVINFVIIKGASS